MFFNGLYRYLEHLTVREPDPSLAKQGPVAELVDAPDLKSVVS